MPETTEATHPLIYLDANATTPVCAEALAAVLPFLTTHFGNPSSSHALSAEPALALALARSRIADLVGASLLEGDRVIFCSCATESISWIIRGVIERSRKRQGDTESGGGGGGGGNLHIVAGATEHAAVLECLKWATSQGLARYTLIDAGVDGRVDSEAFASASSGDDTALVTLMLANNETGAINDVARAVRLIRQAAQRANRPAPFIHCDASQAAGKITIDFHSLNVDALTLAGHKLYAPKGVGCTVLRAGVMIPPALLLGGSQESGSRAGTENIAYAAAFGAAAQVARDWLADENGGNGSRGGGVARHTQLRARLATKLADKFSDIGVNMLIHGPPDQSFSLPNTLSFGIRGLRASALVRALRDTVAISAGSACHAGDTEHASHVLASMGRGGGADAVGGIDIFNEFAKGTVRLSLARSSTDEEIDRAVVLIVNAVAKLLNIAVAVP